VVRDERIRWKDWLLQQGMTPPKPKKTGIKRRLKVGAKQLLRIARQKLHKT
jgi:hypothetical protein